MELVFRKLIGNEVPEPGELWVRPARPGDANTRALAALVLDRGPDALERGAGPVERVVVRAEGTQPTFDEMLAADLAVRRLAGEALPAEYGPFARYAELVRKGWQPAELPVESSIEGVFLALRNEGGGDLTDPETGRRFLAEWRRMAGRIAAAAAAGTDPFRAPLFDGPDFAGARAYLARDRDVYRQDVLRGERWRVRLPGGPPLGAALLLRKPKSLLFKYWCRRDREAPAGRAYLFLAVDWGAGCWVFSTDPAMKLDLRPLAERLRRAEARRDPARAAADSWSDGREFGHTLVAAPRAGTRLADKEVVRVVRGWLGVRRVPVKTAAFALGGVMLLLSSWLAAGALRTAPVPAPAESADYTVAALYVNGRPAPPDEARSPAEADDDPSSPVFSKHVPVTLAPGPNDVRLDVADDFSEPCHVRLWVGLRADDVAGVSLDAVRVNDADLPAAAPTRVGQSLKTPEEPAVLEAGRANRIQVRAVNATGRPLRADLRYSFREDPDHVNLFVVAVGVSHYRNNDKSDPRKDLDLTYADHDADDLAAALRRQQGAGLFHEVKAEVLTDAAATKDAILKKLVWLRQNADEHDLAVVTFSGHGVKHPTSSEEFFFLPTDYDPDEELAATALSWQDMWRELSDVKCRVVLMVDACHSGAIRLPGLKGPPEAPRKEEVEAALREFTGAHYQRGLVLLSACLKDQAARENPDWKHGALTKAVLECLNEGKGAEGDSVINLSRLDAWVEARVPELAGKDQAVVVSQTGNLSYRQIPIAVAPGGR